MSVSENDAKLIRIVIICTVGVGVVYIKNILPAAWMSDELANAASSIIMKDSAWGDDATYIMEDCSQGLILIPVGSWGWF